MPTRKLKAYFKRIAKLYGCKVKFDKDEIGGSAPLKGTIIIGTQADNVEMIGTFCHELAHHCNQIDKKYKKYHTPGGGWFNKDKYKQSIAYAYAAEVYTEKRAKKLCKMWFPGTKYVTFYNKDRFSQGFLYGYYMN